MVTQSKVHSVERERVREGVRGVESGREGERVEGWKGWHGRRVWRQATLAVAAGLAAEYWVRRTAKVIIAVLKQASWWCLEQK